MKFYMCNKCLQECRDAKLPGHSIAFCFLFCLLVFCLCVCLFFLSFLSPQKALLFVNLLILNGDLRIPDRILYVSVGMNLFENARYSCSARHVGKIVLSGEILFLYIAWWMALAAQLLDEVSRDKSLIRQSLIHQLLSLDTLRSSQTPLNLVAFSLCPFFLWF